MMCLELSDQQIRERGGLLDNIMDISFDAAILVDRECRIIHCSKGSLILTGKTNEEVRGKSVNNLDSASPFEKVMATGDAVNSLLVVIQGRKCMTNIVPIKWEGKVIGAFGMVLFQNLGNLKKILSNLNEHAEKTETGKNMYDILARVDSNYTFADYIGESKIVKEMLHYCRRVAKTVYPVLIIGETGTGKEILASGFHSANLANTFTPFIKINCTAIPNDLLESELFGHEKGAFTGAVSVKKGKFELASGGAILLDEIGDMEFRLQSKLLRVLEEKEFERVGGNSMLPLNARIIASTNQDLKKRVKQGLFREDLYFRLSAIEIDVPALRDRTDDIPVLLNHFIAKNSMKLTFTRQAMEVLQSYDWPGNVRELRNFLYRLSITAEGQVIGEEAVGGLLKEKSLSYHSKEITGENAEMDVKLNKNALAQNEKQCIINALQETEYNITEASRLLGITRATLYNKIRKHGLNVNKRLSTEE